MARIVRSERADVPVDTVLNLSAFDLDQVLERRPTFLEPEYPFEWTGIYALQPGRYDLSLAEGPDPVMSLVALNDVSPDDAALRQGAEHCVRRYADPATPVEPGDQFALGEHVSLQLQASGRKSFFLQVESPVKVGLYAQHTAEEFDMTLSHAESGAAVPVEAERLWVAQHEHDDEVSSLPSNKRATWTPSA